MRRRWFLKLLASLPLAAAVRPSASSSVGALRSPAPTYSALRITAEECERARRAWEEHGAFELWRACNPPITWDANTRSWRPVE